MGLSNSQIQISGSQIDNGSISFNKIQDVNSQILLGRYTAGVGVLQEITLGSGLDLSGLGVLSASGTGGTVTNFSSGNLSPLFTTNVSNPTTTPSLSFTLDSQLQNLVFASPNGSSGTPTFRQVVNADLVNSSITIGSTNISLGGTATSIIGLTSVTSTSFVGSLTGNASTATALQTPRTINGVAFDGTANIIISSNTTNDLTVGTGLQYNSGTTFNGSVAKTISIDSTVVTLTGSQALSNKTGLISQWTNDSGYLTTNQNITLSGDVTGSGTTAITTTIANQAVTFTKIQNITTNRLLGRSTAGTGSIEELLIGSGLSLSGGTLTATGSGGTVTGTGAINRVAFWDSSTSISSSSTFLYDSINDRLTIGTGANAYVSDLNITKNTNATVRLSISNQNTGTSAAISTLFTEDAGRYGGFARFGQNVTGNYVASIPYASLFSFFNSIGTGEGNGPVSFRGSPIYFPVASTVSNISMALHTVGMKIAAMSSIHTAPNSYLQVIGSFATGYVQKSASYSIVETDHTIEVTSGTNTQTLPTAVGITGRHYEIINSGTGVVTVATTGGQTINGVSTQVLGEYQSVIVRSNGSNWLKVTTTGEFTGTISFGGDLTPPNITGNTNNYSPTGLSTCNFLRLSTTGNFNITGLLAPATAVNQGIFICNVGTNNFILKNQDAGSTAANRFLLGGDRTIQADEGLMVIYDQVSQRWRSQASNL